MERPYVVLNCAMSLDGYIDDRSGEPLRLSGAEDIDRVDELRAGCDAILVGAGTIRADDPVLLLRSEARRDARIARGARPDPVRAVITASGDLDPAARIFTTGADRIVYAPLAAAAAVRDRLGSAAEVVAAEVVAADAVGAEAGAAGVAATGDPRALSAVLADLAVRGVTRLLVEGGTSVLTQFLAGDLADELVLAIAPFFVGDAAAPRFVQPADFPWRPGHRARLTEVTRAGDMAVLRYALSSRAAG